MSAEFLFVQDSAFRINKNWIIMVLCNVFPHTTHILSTILAYWKQFLLKLLEGKSGKEDTECVQKVF